VSRAGAPSARAERRRPQTMGDLLDQVDELRAAGREADAMELLKRINDALWERALELQQRHGR
jgi:hypothetical protein